MSTIFLFKKILPLPRPTPQTGETHDDCELFPTEAGSRAAASVCTGCVPPCDWGRRGRQEAHGEREMESCSVGSTVVTV